MKYWLFLIIAIVAEVVGTTALKASDGFRKLPASLLVAVGYGVSLYFLSLTVKTLPVGISYAVWAGLGLLLITLTSWIFYGQRIDLPAGIGMILIVTGVIIMNLFSKSIPH